jgi:hypothetical protein
MITLQVHHKCYLRREGGFKPDVEGNTQINLPEVKKNSNTGRFLSGVQKARQLGMRATMGAIALNMIATPALATPNHMPNETWLKGSKVIEEQKLATNKSENLQQLETQFAQSMQQSLQLMRGLENLQKSSGETNSRLINQ